MSTEPREWWIGVTQHGFDKWLSKKDPNSDFCAYKFVSIDGQDECVEMIPAIERAAYQSLEQKLAVAVRALNYIVNDSSSYGLEAELYCERAKEALALINPTKGDV